MHDAARLGGFGIDARRSKGEKAEHGEGVGGRGVRARRRPLVDQDGCRHLEQKEGVFVLEKRDVIFVLDDTIRKACLRERRTCVRHQKGREPDEEEGHGGGAVLSEADQVKEEIEGEGR